MKFVILLKMIPFWYIADFLEVEEGFFSPQFYACVSDIKIQPSFPSVYFGNLSNTKTKIFSKQK